MEVDTKGKMFIRKHTQSHFTAANRPPEPRPMSFIKLDLWSVNTPVVFGRMLWGWSQPGQAPGTAGGHHTQTACLTGA